ncbi:MAG: amidase family protein [Pseudomonadota bacterium]
MTDTGSHGQLADLDAHAQASLVQRGVVSPSAPVEAAIARIEALDSLTNAVSHRAFDHARKAARTVDRMAPMAGVPYLLKASMEYPGFPQVSGSRACSSRMAKRQYPFSQRLDEAGLIPCGMSTMPEFGLLGTGEALLYGPTRNPWDLDRTAGGSSSGSAVAVATGMVPFATGSDGGGSIRIPASHCGIIGFKPSRDWNLRARASNLVDDLLASDALYGRSMRDTIWAARLLRRQPPVAPVAKTGLRIAVSLRGLDGELAAPEIVAMIERSATLCEAIGHHVEHRELPIDHQALSRAFDVLWSYGGGDVADAFAGTGEDGQPRLEPWTLGLAARRDAMTPDDLAEALAQLALLHQSLEAYWQDYDVVLSPVTSDTAPLVGVLAPDRAFDALWRDHFRHVNYTQLQNLGGFPGISLPLFEAAPGVPAGAMFWARRGADDLLLALGAQLEEAQPWASRRPPLILRSAEAA